MGVPDGSNKILKPSIGGLKQVQDDGHAETTDEASSKIDSSGIPQNDGGDGVDAKSGGTMSKTEAISALGRGRGHPQRAGQSRHWDDTRRQQQFRH